MVWFSLLEREEKPNIPSKFLLENRISSQTEISHETGVAIGYVNEVVHELFDLNIVNIGYGKCTLIDHVKLLEKINFDRKFKKLRFKEFRLPTSSIKDTEFTLVNFSWRAVVGQDFRPTLASRAVDEQHKGGKSKPDRKHADPPYRPS